MEFGGIQKTSLADYPGKIAIILFTTGCNYACPYCHNPSLSAPEKSVQKADSISEADALAFLKKRKKYADGLVITGGEPTLYAEKGLVEFIRKVRALGYAVKLDTNGSNPEFLEQLLKERLLDYVAIDLKGAPEQYEQLARPKKDSKKEVANVEKSARLVMNSGVDYEFRTTVIKGMHTPESIGKMCEWIGSGKRLFLQRFKPGACLENNWNEKLPPDDEEMRAMAVVAKRFFKEVGDR